VAPIEELCGLETASLGHQGEAGEWSAAGKLPDVSGAAPKPPASRISRVDVAHLMLSILAKTETYHRAINCSY
jgi:hypothetical protein